MLVFASLAAMVSKLEKLGKPIGFQVGYRADGSMKVRYPAEVSQCAVRLWTLCKAHRLIVHDGPFGLSIKDGMVIVKPKLAPVPTPPDMTLAMPEAPVSARVVLPSPCRATSLPPVPLFPEPALEREAKRRCLGGLICPAETEPEASAPLVIELECPETQPAEDSQATIPAEECDMMTMDRPIFIEVDNGNLELEAINDPYMDES